ncbi:hypothetical protein P3X46_027054 [Hevea brasiliensis]|uniref:Uncharacterized protein n=1 Tax=Hevea brasiliensis TaxID=3981 RepID=A0ABQ9KYK0_HEVBR|nr:uncharacterized protein LOC110643740 [Hevea brasiliensis]KAJ9153633.1 hypothetical protein P3X46_027054 [Hevea brasiliensis]
MTSAIKIERDRQDKKFGWILSNLAKFAVKSNVNNAPKGVTGPQKLFKFVQERLQDPPTSLPLNNCKKPEDVKLEEMQTKVEEMLEDMAKLKQQNETSAKCTEVTEPLKKGPNEGSRKLDVLGPEKKRIFIRSRL